MIVMNTYPSYGRLKMLIFSGAFVLLAMFCADQKALAQEKPALEYQVKAAFLFNFTKFVYWPEMAFNTPNAPFVIGIIGRDPFGSYLEDIIANEKVGGHPIMVQRYPSLREITGCHILYISPNNVPIKNVIEAYRQKKNVLTVSDAGGLGNWEGIVSFYVEENKVKLRIGVKAAKNAELEISSKLLKIAKLQ